MARLAYIPILCGATNISISQMWQDQHVEKLESDGATGVFSFDLVSEDHIYAHVKGKYSGGMRRTVTEFAVIVEKDPPPSIVQRVNRLLKGTGAEFKFYHRSGDTRLNIPGSWLALPRTVSGVSTTVWSSPPAPPGFTGSARSTLSWDFKQDGVSFGIASTPPSSPIATAAVAPVPVPYLSPSTSPDDEEVDVVPPEEPEEAEKPSEDPTEDVAALLTVMHGDERGLFTFPEVDKKTQVIIPADMLEDLDLHWKLHVQGHRQILAMVGPTGTGKTSLAFNLAARKGVGIMTFDAVGAREFGDWVGTTHLRDGKTEFIASGFLDAIDADGPYAGMHRIILIDEVNRAESSGALNALMPVLHGFGSIYVPEIGRAVKVDHTAMVIMTANRGSQYAGTVGLDRALADRVTAWFKLEYLTNGTEVDVVVTRSDCTVEEATALCKAGDSIRRADERGELPEGGGISTRAVIEAAIKVKGGAPLHRAATRAWVGLYPEEGGSSSEAAVVQTAIDGVLRSL